MRIFLLLFDLVKLGYMLKIMTTYLKFAVYIVVFSSLLISVGAFAQGLQGLASGGDVAENVSEHGGEPLYRALDSADVFGVDDDIKVTVYGEDALSNTFKIGDLGTISFPFIGDVQVRRKTVQQVKGVIESRLSDGYLKNPRVSIEIVSNREFYILGEVRTPGSYKYKSGVTALQAVGLAGGFTSRAYKKHVQVLKPRKGASDLYEKMLVDAVIEPGDIILVKER